MYGEGGLDFDFSEGIRARYWLPLFLFALSCKTSSVYSLQSSFLAAHHFLLDRLNYKHPSPKGKTASADLTASDECKPVADGVHRCPSRASGWTQTDSCLRRQNEVQAESGLRTFSRTRSPFRCQNAFVVSTTSSRPQESQHARNGHDKHVRRIGLYS